jgi:DNA-directed RNA polymerase subunit RPC12/RpoP
MADSQEYQPGTPVQLFLEMLESQQYRCAICRRTLDLERSTHLDYSSDNQVRQILCGSCMLILVFANDDPAVLEDAAAYLKRFS